MVSGCFSNASETFQGDFSELQGGLELVLEELQPLKRRFMRFEGHFRRIKAASIKNILKRHCVPLELLVTSPKRPLRPFKLPEVPLKLPQGRFLKPS